MLNLHKRMAWVTNKLKSNNDIYSNICNHSKCEMLLLNLRSSQW
jgi:hypothetical protein